MSVPLLLEEFDALHLFGIVIVVLILSLPRLGLISEILLFHLERVKDAKGRGHKRLQLLLFIQSLVFRELLLM